MAIPRDQWLQCFEALVEHSRDFVAIASLSGDVEFLNHAGRRLIHMDDDVDISQTSITDYLTEEGVQVSSAVEQPAVMQNGFWLGVSTLRDWAGGPPIPVEISSFLIRDSSQAEPIALATVQRDIRDRISQSQELAYFTQHDVLTGLPNREAFLVELQGALDRAKESDTNVAVLYLDVDRFKGVNDSLGHARADEILREIADRLVESLGSDGIVGRFGGDEFLIAVENVDDYLGAQQIGIALVHAFDRPFHGETSDGDSEDIFISVSVGVALGAYDEDPKRLISRADAEAYRSKELGRARASVERPGNRGPSVDDYVGRIRELHVGLDRGEFEVYYQPLVSYPNCAIVGAEALLRWRRGGRDYRSPDEFIPLAEQTGLITRLGEFVLDEVGRELQEILVRSSEFKLAMNVSAIQMFDADFPTMVSSVMSRREIPPDHLILELTESLAMEDLNYSGQTLYDLKACGVLLSIDDFGTGFSSMRRLRNLPFDVLKIDREFVQGLPDISHDAGVVRAVLALGEALGLSTVAEGVETLAQEQALVEFGCQFAQGYFYAKPLERRAFRELL